MKAILISLVLLATTTIKAETTDIRFGGTDAPIFARLDLAGITRNMTLINPRFSGITAASLTFNNKSLTLTLNKSMPKCAQGMMCIQVMPAPMIVTLDVVTVERTKCSVVYTATTPTNVKSMISEVVTVEDYTDSTCPITIASVGLVTYKVRGVSSLTKQPETATANFYVIGQFIRAQN